MTAQASRGAGQLHPKAVLSDREVETLRRLREVENWSYRKLAEAFEISKESVADFCKYRRR